MVLAGEGMGRGWGEGGGGWGNYPWNSRAVATIVDYSNYRFPAATKP